LRCLRTYTFTYTVYPMPQKEILRAVEGLHRQVGELRGEILSFKEEREGFSELRGILCRRGLESFRHNPTQHLFFPPRPSSGRDAEVLRKRFEGDPCSDF
jgi:hypothetical protein